MRFINDDVKLKNGGRKAVIITKEELCEKIIARGCKFDSSIAKGDTEEGKLWDSVFAMLEEDATIQKDNKFELGSDHLTVSLRDYEDFFDAGACPDIGEPLIGLHTMPNGCPYLGFITAGDEQSCAFSVLYWDGKKIRMYTPSYGNIVNLDFGCAIGSEDWADVDDEAVKRKYKNLGIWDDDATYADMYFAKYELDVEEPDEAGYNWTAILQDIAARIEPV